MTNESKTTKPMTKEDVAWSKGYIACVREVKKVLRKKMKQPNLRADYKYWLEGVIKMLGEEL